MFTGIVTETGAVRNLSRRGGRAEISVEASALARDVAIGDSVAVNGACLTVTATDGDLITFDVVSETLAKTTLGDLRHGSEVNLEGALKVGDRLSGHFVMGHVDGVGEVVSRSDDASQVTIRFRAPAPVEPYLLEKGSISVDGVSLTIWDVRAEEFSVAVVPHTLAETALRGLRRGARVNLEADVLARWIAKLMGRTGGEGLTLERLRRAGYDA